MKQKENARRVFRIRVDFHFPVFRDFAVADRAARAYPRACFGL
jgi:hypothetical protein